MESSLPVKDPTQPTDRRDSVACLHGAIGRVLQAGAVADDEALPAACVVLIADRLLHLTDAVERLRQEVHDRL